MEYKILRVTALINWTRNNHQKATFPSKEKKEKEEKHRELKRNTGQTATLRRKEIGKNTWSLFRQLDESIRRTFQGLGITIKNSNIPTNRKEK